MWEVCIGFGKFKEYTPGQFGQLSQQKWTFFADTYNNCGAQSKVTTQGLGLAKFSVAEDLGCLTSQLPKSPSGWLPNFFVA